MTDKPKQPSNHGKKAPLVRVQLRSGKIHMRSAGARELLAFKAQLISDMGGELNISAARMALIDLAARTRALIAHIDAWLLEQPSLVNKRKKSLPSVVMQRQTLCDALARYLGQLGLERKERDAGTLPAAWVERVKPPSDEPETQAEPAPMAETQAEPARMEQSAP